MGPEPYGAAYDGEVEDYTIVIEEEPPPDEYDWGDAPDVPGGPGYQTLSVNNGANHFIIAQPPLYLGAFVDPEPDGQPDPNALGDDMNILYPGIAWPPGDEDGVTFVTPLIPGQQALVNVTVSPGGGWLAIWLDSDGSSTWAPVAEMVWGKPRVVFPLNRIFSRRV